MFKTQYPCKDGNVTITSQGYYLFSSLQFSQILKHYLACLILVSCSQNIVFEWMITCSCSFVILAMLGMKVMRGQFVLQYFSESTLPETGSEWDPAWLTPMSSGTLCINKITQESSSQKVWPHFQSNLRKQEVYTGICNWYHRTDCGPFSFVNEKQCEEVHPQKDAVENKANDSE